MGILGISGLIQNRPIQNRVQLGFHARDTVLLDYSTYKMWNY